jgi:hypothetical protein
MGAQIFPRFSGTHKPNNEGEYCLSFEFEKDAQLMFEQNVGVQIWLRANEEFEHATEIVIRASTKTGKSVFEGKWTETFTVETASLLVQQSLLQIADQIVPKGH